MLYLNFQRHKFLLLFLTYLKLLSLALTQVEGLGHRFVTCLSSCSLSILCCDFVFVIKDIFEVLAGTLAAKFEGLRLGGHLRCISC